MRAVLLFTALVLTLAPTGAFAETAGQDPSFEPLPGLDLPGIEDLLPEPFDAAPDDVPGHPVPPSESASPPAPDRAPLPPPPPQAQLTREERLDKLFADLKRESNATAAARIAGRIESEWADSGSATVDLLVGWAGEAMAKDDKPAALDLLSEAIAMKPDFAESWNRRATLHFLADDYGKSLADIEQTLAREPRHYGALMGLGAILEQTGRETKALEAYTKVLEVYPTMKPAQDAVARLSEDLAGRAI